MSVRMTLFAISDADRVRLLANPPLVKHLLDDEPRELVARDVCELNREWEPLHFVLAGDSDVLHGPLAFLLGEGERIGDVDVGYGPARTFSAAETAVIAAALDAFSPELFDERLDARVLIGICNSDDMDGDRARLNELYRSLREFVRAAAKAKQALVITL